MIAKTVTVEIFRDGSMCFVPVPFDPKAIFGKVRAPVKVTLNGYTYRSTIATMGGAACIPLRKSHREAAGLEGGERLTVRIELDVEPRKVEIPADLAQAFKQEPAAAQAWRTMSYTHQREHAEAIEEAKKPETRQRRVDAAMRMLLAKKIGAIRGK
jgi:regulator of protease activity HflC (stomatin/prohibitin superfamily)